MMNAKRLTFPRPYIERITCLQRSVMVHALGTKADGLLKEKNEKDGGDNNDSGVRLGSGVFRGKGIIRRSG